MSTVDLPFSELHRLHPVAQFKRQSAFFPDTPSFSEIAVFDYFGVLA